MPGDVLKKRKIAVLGSRSVGARRPFLRHSHTPLLTHLSLSFFFFFFFFAPPCTGKSSLVIQYIENHFVESYYPTIESTFSKSINYQGIDYDCDIIDTAGQVRSPSSPPSPYNDSLTTSSATPPFHHRTSLQSSTPNMPSVFMAMFSYIQSLPESHLK